MTDTALSQVRTKSDSDDVEGTTEFQQEHPEYERLLIMISAQCREDYTAAKLSLGFTWFEDTIFD